MKKQSSDNGYGFGFKMNARLKLDIGGRSARRGTARSAYSGGGGGGGMFGGGGGFYDTTRLRTGAADMFGGGGGISGAAAMFGGSGAGSRGGQVYERTVYRTVTEYREMYTGAGGTSRGYDTSTDASRYVTAGVSGGYDTSPEAARYVTAGVSGGYDTSPEAAGYVTAGVSGGYDTSPEAARYVTAGVSAPARGKVAATTRMWGGSGITPGGSRISAGGKRTGSSRISTGRGASKLAAMSRISESAETLENANIPGEARKSKGAADLSGGSKMAAGGKVPSAAARPAAREQEDRLLRTVNLDENAPPRISKYVAPTDPVRQQKLAEQQSRKPLEVIPEQQSVVSVKIEPSVGTRLDMQYVHDVNFEEGQPRPEYVYKRTKKQQRLFEKNRANTAKGFCKYDTIEFAEPIPTMKVQLKADIPSPEPSSAKVTPRRVTPTSSWLYPYPQTSDELQLKKPKSGIFINERKGEEGTKDYDSFDLVYSRKPRPDVDFKRKNRKRSKSGGALDAIDEDDEETGTKKKKRKKRSPATKESTEPEAPIEEVYMQMIEQEMMEQMQGEDGLGDYLTKQFRRKVSQISAATSYQSKDYEEEKELLGESASKYNQKFRTESEIQRYEPKKRKFKRGTLESHSFTNIYQPVLRDFYFGSKEGTMHQGDEQFPENVRNLQGICMPVAAYCYSILKHPNKWCPENIDEILEVGNNLFLSSCKGLHMHGQPKELKPRQLDKYCVIGEKKIKFVIDDPEISGYIRSDDKRVYNLTKGLNIFFARQKAGIFKTQDTSLVIWKDKYFYMFDAKPRTKDLYPAPNGTAIMANFYDIPSLITVFLNRSCYPNWPFIIYPIKAMKILGKDEIDKDETKGLDVRSNYNILNQNKAVVQGSFDLADKCFDFTRNKQSLAISTVALVYSRITPPSAWHRTTVDKIMMIGNQLYLECIECEAIDELRLDNLPAIFTVGPYIVEIYIFVNCFVDMMFKNCCCQFLASLEDFFEKSTNAIVQIDKHHIAVWKQRNMYYCFDPYSRDNEGFQTRDGTACVSMHANISSLVDTITTNFDSKDMVFHMHALKVCKIFRDPVQSTKFPRHVPMDDYTLEDIKTYKMMKSKKPATAKPVTVDYSALAIRRLLAGESPDPSLFEIGSNVGSLGLDEIPAMVHKHPSRSILKAKPFERPEDLYIDLDSPSLSDTQIEPAKPQEPKTEFEVEFMDLDSFELTMEEIELEEVVAEAEYLPAVEEVKGFEGEDQMGEEMEDEMMQMQEGEEDWYWAMKQYAQVGPSLQIEPSKISEQINTDITFFPIHKEILYPTYIRGKQEMKKRLDRTKGDEVFDIFLPQEPDVTQSEELRKDTNFVTLPDNTQIVRGTKNVIAYGEDIEYMAPFMCIMAGVVSRKYSVLTWTPEIVDYILKCGSELYSASKYRYDQVSKLEIPRISLGKTTFTCLVQYVFDSYLRQNILELAINKILFVRSNMGVLLTPTYACGLIYRNHLYYMYDPFGSNEVGLGEGLNNTGVACFSRFKDVNSMVKRILYNKSKREVGDTVVYTRFVISVIQAKEIHERDDMAKKKDKKEKEKKDVVDEGEDVMGADMDMPDEDMDQEEEDEEKKEEDIKVGYQYKDGLFVIEGSDALQGRDAASDSLKEDHFVCLCVCLTLLNVPVTKWDNKRVDKVLDYGKHVFSHADDLEVSEKRTIKNVLIDKNFFDIVVKRIRIENWKNNKNMNAGIDTLLSKKLSYFIVQFPNAGYVVHRTTDGMFHIFDPYGVPKSKNDDEEGAGANAGWIRCKNVEAMKRRLKKMVQKGSEGYSFYNFEVTSIRKAPKDMLINFRLNQYDLAKKPKPEFIGKPFYEDAEWLTIDPIPWSRKVPTAADGHDRGTTEHLWHNWDIEYSKDLYSLLGNVNQNSERFSEESRGKQTLANLVCCVGMMEIYDFTEWNSAVIDSILVNGDNYFRECVEDIKDEDYELSIDDMKEDCSIFPFAFKVTFKPIVEGTMFLVRATQFNLYKALRYFFNNRNKRSGIICCTKSNIKKQVAFGKTKQSEYYVFDSDSFGGPMFLEKTGVAYILRMTTLNRLLHVLTLTLGGGDFYIYDVTVNNLEPVK